MLFVLLAAGLDDRFNDSGSPSPEYALSIALGLLLLLPSDEVLAMDAIVGMCLMLLVVVDMVLAEESIDE